MSGLEVSVEGMLKDVRSLVKNYATFLNHTPKMLRQSMMLAYQTAVDDMLMAMDKNRTKDPVIHEEKKSVTLLDENGNAAT